jgi:5-methylthioadenosine/S-adenosylhomocysteine deaminase
MWSVQDLPAALLLHAGPRDVDTVLVAGEVMKRGGRLVAGGLETARERLEASGRRILADFDAARRAAA